LNVLNRWLNQWREDRLLRTVVRNSSYLFSSNTISMGLASLQGLLAAALLSVADYGLLGMIIAFASNINRLLSFRMSELVVKYAGQYLAEEDKSQAAAVIKIAGLSEALTSVFAYSLLVLTAHAAAVYIIKDEAAAPWILLYGLALLANLMTETAMAVLQLGGHFRTLAVLNLGQNLLTASWIGVVFLQRGSLMDVLVAYLAGKLLYGMGVMVAAVYWLRPLLGHGWWQVSPNKLRHKKELIRFAFSTNLSQTVNMLIRDNEVLWVGFFLSTVEAGYYKFGLAIMNVIVLPISPFIQTTFPEINRTVTQRVWARLRLLLRRTSWIAAGWTLITGLGMVLTGPALLAWFKNGQYGPAFPVILVLFAGFSFANLFYWNRPLMLALERPNFPLLVTFSVGLIKTVLMFLLVRPFGVIMQALLLSGYFIISIGIIVWKGLWVVQQAQEKDIQKGYTR
jgi:O-antigen/teichoic acid export membrane protein